MASSPSKLEELLPRSLPVPSCKYKAVDQPQRPLDVLNPSVEIAQVLKGLICHSPVCCEDAVDAK